MIRSSSRAAIAPPKPPPAMTTFQAMRPQLALCNNVVTKCSKRTSRLCRSLLLDQAVDLAAVGAALGLLHHGADDRADRLLRCRRGSARRPRGWPRSRRRRSTSSSPLSEIWARPSRSTIAAGSPPSATRVASTCLPLPWEIFFSPTMTTSAARASGVTFDSADASLSPVLAQRRRQLAGHPVGDDLRLDPAGGAAALARSRRRSPGRRRAASPFSGESPSSAS